MDSYVEGPVLSQTMQQQFSGWSYMRPVEGLGDGKNHSTFPQSLRNIPVLRFCTYRPQAHELTLPVRNSRWKCQRPCLWQCGEVRRLIPCAPRFSALETRAIASMALQKLSPRCSETIVNEWIGMQLSIFCYAYHSLRCACLSFV